MYLCLAIQLHYADQFAENGIQAAFDPHGHVDSRLEQAENEEFNVEVGVIEIRYDSNHEIGTDEFNLELSAGVYSGVVDATRTAYELDWTVNDVNGEEYHVHVDNDYAQDFLEGNISETEMITEVQFNELNS